MYLAAAGFLIGVAHGQVTLTSTDLANPVGTSFSMYSNDFKPTDSSTSFAVGGLMGSAGASQFWDFTAGPQDKVTQYDYLAPSAVPESVDFPQAKIVERTMTAGQTNASYLFFEQVPGVGRKVYGFYDAAFSPDTPANVFRTPIVDFPDQISYLDSWTTTATFNTSIAVTVPPELGEFFDPGSIESIPAQITMTSTFKVDAWGILELPLLGFGDALRVNEEQTISVSVDLEGMGQYEHIEDDYTRNYYWLRRGYGLVAQMNSVQSTTPPPEKFDRATAFVRTFKTNKKLSAGCVGPAPVTDLRISYGDGKALLKWTKPQCAKQFQVEVSASAAGGWTPLGAPTSSLFLLDDVSRQNTAKFYRVLSLP